MAKRYKPHQARAARQFTHDARRTLTINHPTTCPRGGIRL